MENKNIVVLNKMIKYTEKILLYTSGMKYEEFLNDTKTIEASVFNLS